MTWRLWRARHSVTDAFKEPSPPIFTSSSSRVDNRMHHLCADIDAVGSADVSVLARVQIYDPLDCILQGFVCVHLFGPISDRFKKASTSTPATVGLCLASVRVEESGSSEAEKKKNKGLINPEMMNILQKASCLC